MLISRTILFFLILGISQAQAHTASDSFLIITPQKSEILLQWDIALRDLEFALGLDSNLDSQLSSAEIKTAADNITNFALGHINISSNRQNCALTPETINIVEHNQQQYFSINSRSNCSTDSMLTIDYQLFSDIDPTHRGLISYKSGNQIKNFIASVKNPVINIDMSNNTSLSNTLSVIYNFIIEGVWHIWIGLDHIIFLLTLLLPSVLLTQTTKRTYKNSKQMLFNVIKLITCFTVAHSITLSLATLSIVTLPSRWIEVAIAASIIVVAINNIKPLVNHASLWLAFIFGLIHGFGFANVLSDLNIKAAIATSIQRLGKVTMLSVARDKVIE